jgi:cytochrome b pre-mRNA-processing protein 3
LITALKRNITPDAQDWPEATLLAAYIMSAVDHLASQSSDSICSGDLTFPVAA